MGSLRQLHEQKNKDSYNQEIADFTKSLDFCIKQAENSGQVYKKSLAKEFDRVLDYLMTRPFYIRKGCAESIFFRELLLNELGFIIEEPILGIPARPQSEIFWLPPKKYVLVPPRKKSTGVRFEYSINGVPTIRKR